MNNKRYQSNTKLILDAGRRRSTSSAKYRRLIAFGVAWLIFFTVFDSLALALNPDPTRVVIGFTFGVLGMLAASYKICSSIKG